MLPSLAILGVALAMIQVPVAFYQEKQAPDLSPEPAPEPGYLDKQAVYSPLQHHQPTWFEMTVLFGSTKSPGKVLIDSGSSNTWVDYANYELQNSTTGTNTSKPYSVGYLGFGAKGWVVEDDIIVGGSKLRFRFGSCDAHLQYPGIMGVSPIAKSSSSANTSIINALNSDGIISSRSYSVWMSTMPDGVVTFGGIDHTKYTGSLTILPIWRRPGHDNDGFGLGVRRWYAYDEERGESSLLMEGLQKCAIDTGATLSILPREMTIAAAAAFNVTQAKNHPEARAAGFGPNQWVHKYTGESGLAIDVQGSFSSSQ